MSVSNGFSYAWDASTPEGAAAGTGQRVVPGSMKLNGEPIDMNTSYRVTVNNFMASGGDNFVALKEGTERATGMMDIDALEVYLQKHPNVTPGPLNRVTRLN